MLSPYPADAQAAPLRLGVGYADSMAEGIYASKNGSFKTAGLNVEIIGGLNTGSALTQAVVAGVADIAISNTINIAIAIAHGAPLKIIAGGALYSAQAPTQALCVTSDSLIRTAKDFEGKTIGVTALRDLTEVGCRAWIDQHGGNATKVRFAELSMAMMPPALQRGTVDGCFIGEPQLAQAKKNGVRVVGNAYDAIASSFLLSAYCTTDAFLAKNPALVKQFCDATYSAARWANSHRSDTAPMLAEAAKMDIALVNSATRMRFATGLDAKMIQPMLTLMQKYDALDKPVAASDLIAG